MNIPILRVRDEQGNIVDIPAIRGKQGAAGPAGPKGDPGTGLKILANFVSKAELEAAITDPEIGAVYAIGASAPYDIYVYEAGGWVNHGPLQGAKGETGAPGPAGPAGQDGKNGSDGTPGSDGISPTVTTTSIEGGTRVTIVDKTGSKYFDVMNGQRGLTGATGATGQPGYTPLRGTDYWTQSDQAAIIAEVLKNFTDVSEVGM